MKLKYTYKEYKGYPKATEISQSRERTATLLFQLCFWGIVIVICLLIGNPEDWVSAVLMISALVAAIFYLLNYYPKVTEKKIQKAIADDIETKTRIASTRHHCKSFKILGKQAVGMCNVCYKQNEALTFCEIDDYSLTRTTYICSSCISKFSSEANKQK